LAHAFRVAARPSLDLSLADSANTQEVFYTYPARMQRLGDSFCHRERFFNRITSHGNVLCRHRFQATYRPIICIVKASPAAALRPGVGG